MCGESFLGYLGYFYGLEGNPVREDNRSAGLVVKFVLWLVIVLGLGMSDHL